MKPKEVGLLTWYLAQKEVRQTMLATVIKLLWLGIDLRKVYAGLKQPGAREFAIEVFIELAQRLEKGGPFEIEEDGRETMPPEPQYPERVLDEEG
ncbi:hypothetical protein KKC88_04310 [Patescibacteria group bacterium]|nr:hypothetical protein [Patescibacteria group bacterium]MBU1964140.1 hypothetical protein [Patescibacteria group bacterium]